MKITYRLRNFKAFQDTGDIDVAPITILCGENSIGKSSILKSLLLLRQSTAERRSRLAQNAPTQPLLFNGELTRLGSWTDAVHGKSRTSKIGMNWAAEGLVSEFVRSRNQRLPTRHWLRRSLKSKFSSTLDVSLRSNSNQTEELSAVLSEIKIKTNELRVDFSEKNEIEGEVYSGVYTASIGSSALLLAEVTPQIEFGFERVKDVIDVLRRSSTPLVTGDLFLSLEGPFPVSTTPKLDANWSPFFDSLLSIINLDRAGTRGPRPGWLQNFEQAVTNFKKNTQGGLEYKSESLQQDIIYSLVRIFCTCLDNAISFCLLAFSPMWKNLRYLGPLRSQPERFYQFDDTGGIDIGVSGEYTVQVLALESNNAITVSSLTMSDGEKILITSPSTKTLLEATNEWLEFMGLPAVHPGALRQSLYELRVGSLNVALPDVGFGVSQVLPTIVEALRCMKGDTVILEQPEIHLHPRVQAALADFFIARAKDGVKFLIESHSEYMIKRLCRRVAESTIDGIADLTNIVFIERSPDQSAKCEKIALNEFGEIMNWPVGFFDTQEDLYWTEATLKRRRSSQRKNPSVV